jgi:sugar phosphate isomerase/epimerase
MKRREFIHKAVLGSISPSVLSVSQVDRLFSRGRTTNEKVPIGLDAHSLRGMKWKAKKLIEYAIDQKMNSILMNSLNYFESLDFDHLKSLRQLLIDEQMHIYFGVGSLSINSTSYSPKFGIPKDLIKQGIRIAKIFNAKSVNCKIGNIADRYSDGGIIARMEEIIEELCAMRRPIEDAGIKFLIENHAGDLRSEEVMQIVETVGKNICGVMLDPGNAVWAMEDPMQQIEKLGKYTLCTSVRDYQIWESENGATFQWTALGGGSMNLQEYTRKMSILCPGVPLHIETISYRENEIPFLQEEFWKGYPDLQAAGLLDFFRMIRNGKPAQKNLLQTDKRDLINDPDNQVIELMKSIDYLKKYCPAMGIYQE